MYLIKIETKPSTIEGTGVFAAEDIQKNTVTWKFDPQIDKSMTPEEFSTLHEEAREALLRVAYFSRVSQKWIYPSENDPAIYTNHSIENNQSVVFNEEVSEELFFIANRNIHAGEELTVNYAEFDSRSPELVEEFIA